MKHTFRYRVHGELAAGAEVLLGGDDSYHLARVVRRRVGDSVELLDPAGRIWPAVVAAVGPPAQVRVGDVSRSAPERTPIDLYLGFVDWGRLDLVVEKVTELGIASVTLMASERGRARGGQAAFDRRRDRMDRVVDAAARQSGRAAGPALRGLVPFPVVIGALATSHGFLVDARGDMGLGEAVRRSGPERAAILIGPDAGFSDREVGAARQSGLSICRLGDATLRAETAAIVAIAVAAEALGHLGSAL